MNAPTADRVKWLPVALIGSRFVIGLAILAISLTRPDHADIIVAALLATGVTTDVFDGVVARRLHISTDGLRKLDSRVDICFFLLSVAGLLVYRPQLLGPVLSLLGVLAVLEVTVHLISFVRFRRESSTHHYLSKLFSLFLFGLIGQLFIVPEVTWFFWLTLGMGVLSFVESGLIMSTIPEWKTDIRSYMDVLAERRAAKKRELS